MELKAQLEVYRSHWLIEWQSAMGCLSIWQSIRNGNASIESFMPIAASKPFVNTAQITYAPNNIFSAKDFAGFNTPTAVIPVMGPIMKNDFCGIFGTASLGNFLQQAIAAEQVQQIVLLIDSPGGSVDGTAAFAQLVASSSKPVTAIVNGMCCSAAYWIASQATSITATSPTDIIGSIGTMCAWYDDTEALKAEGIVLREYYADASTDKNRSMREARDGKGKLLVETMLNPLNDVFLSAVKTGRGSKLKAEEKGVLSGQTFIGQAAINNGLIDAISPMQTALQALSYNKKKYNMSQAFLKVAAATKSEGFEVVEGGFLLTEEQLTTLDAALANVEETATAHQATVQQLQEAATAHQATIATQVETIAALQAEVATLKKQPATTPTAPKGEGDPAPAPLVSYETKYDAEVRNLLNA